MQMKRFQHWLSKNKAIFPSQKTGENVRTKKYSNKMALLHFSLERKSFKKIVVSHIADSHQFFLSDRLRQGDQIGRSFAYWATVYFG
jgi:hypothetical protein